MNKEKLLPKEGILPGEPPPTPWPDDVPKDDGWNTDPADDD